jgi:hypothetical protein
MNSLSPPAACGDEFCVGDGLGIADRLRALELRPVDTPPPLSDNPATLDIRTTFEYRTVGSDI